MSEPTYTVEVDELTTASGAPAWNVLCDGVVVAEVVRQVRPVGAELVESVLVGTFRDVTGAISWRPASWSFEPTPSPRSEPLLISY